MSKKQEISQDSEDIAIDDKYILIKELGAGAQGSVYCIKDINSGAKFASKLYKKHDRFLLEYEIMGKLNGLEGFPRVHDSTMIEGHSMLIMDMLGSNLRSLKEKYGNKLSLHTCLQLMHALIMRLEKLHEAGYVHCDLKPDNILIGISQNDSTIYLIDYGLAHCYLDSEGNHMKHPENVSFKGSISYCALNILNKKHPSRRDDIESLLYVILFLLYGELPWHEGAQKLRGQERLNYVIKFKQEAKIKDYGKHIPKSILKTYKYVRKLQYQDKPDYDLIKYFIIRDLESAGLALDDNYEWSDETSSPTGIFHIPSLPQSSPVMFKSYYEREYHRISIESASMEVEYKDLLSIEIDEGVNIGIKLMSPKRNDLSSLSLSPASKFDSYGADYQDSVGPVPSFSLTPDKTKSPKSIQRKNSDFTIAIKPMTETKIIQKFGGKTTNYADEFDEQLESGLKTRRGVSFKMSTDVLVKIKNSKKQISCEFLE